jgi:phytoene dehydrogenase-like protein
MAEQLNAVIIGGGHNGLTTAAYLAQRGLRVKLFEARPVLGGAAVTEEFYPGFRNSSCSYVVGMLCPKVIEELALRDHGLRIVKRPTDMFAPRLDGGHLLQTSDTKAFKAQLDHLHPGDGDAYDRFNADLGELLPIVRALMERRSPNLNADMGSLLAAAADARDARHLPPRARALLLRLMTASAGNFLDRYFQHDAVKGMFGSLALVGSLQGPYAQGSAYVLLHHLFGESNGEQSAWGHAIGGMGAVSDAIARAGAAHGVQTEVNAPVVRITTQDGVASGIVLADGREIRANLVIANVNPKILYGRLLDQALLPDDVKADMAHYRCGSGTLRMNVALSELPNFTAMPGLTPGPQHLGSVMISPSLAYLERAYTDTRDGSWASAPMIEMWISSTLDPTLAPEGKHVASLFCQHFSPVLSGGRDWDDHREEAADLVVRTITQYAPNFAGSIIGRSVLTPKDLERTYHLTGGDIFHGALALDQLFAMRPVAGFADHRTPVPGVYLCGAGAHPGGGVTGIPGRNAAREVMLDLRAKRFRLGHLSRRRVAAAA